MVRTELKGDIAALRLDVSEDPGGLRGEIRELRKSSNTLTKSVDRFLKILEGVEMEQAAIRADLERIKQVLKEKLGVEL